MTVDPGYAGTVALVAQPAPAPNPDDPGGRGEDFGKASPVGFVVLVVFLVAVALLVRSMNKHLRRVPATFDDRDEHGRVITPGGGSGAAAGPDGSAGSGGPDGSNGSGGPASRDGAAGRDSTGTVGGL